MTKARAASEPRSRRRSAAARLGFSPPGLNSGPFLKVRTTPENEAYLVQVGELGTVSHVEKLVRLYRRSDRAEELAAANALHAERGLRCYFDESGALVVEVVRHGVLGGADTTTRTTYRKAGLQARGAA